MDFLKTLLMYMTMTFAVSVQDAPVPEPTPVPTAAPTAIVEVQETPAPAAEETFIIPTIAQTEAPTPAAVPTISPNPAYRNLKVGDRGENVRKLQERLIELGYLDGKADGAYGNQTRKAVLMFQYYNGLTQDGVAGRSTQTQLFENPDVAWHPSKATPTPEPTATPTAPPTAVPEPTADAAYATPEPASELPTPAISVPGLTEIANARIVLTGSGQPLMCLRLEDGVLVDSFPRVWRNDSGAIIMAAAELCDGLTDWTITMTAEHAYTLNAGGYEIVITGENSTFTVTTDGVAVDLAEGDVTEDNGTLYISAAFLEKAMNAKTLWDIEENTLMLTFVSKEVAQATD